MTRVPRMAVLVLLAVAGVLLAGRQAQASGGFAPLEAWRKAVVAGDAAALRRMYSHDASAHFQSPESKGADAKDEIAFWSGFKAKGLSAVALEMAQVQPVGGMGDRQVVFTATLTMAGHKRLYVNEAQLWTVQGNDWAISAAKRTETARLEQPLATPSIYPAGTDAKQQIATALAAATKEHKRVLVVFGADWCFDCHVLDKAFERADIAPLVERSYKVVHVDIGKGDKNQDLMAKYGVPMEKGIPGVAVLDASGKLLYSQRNGEFEKARGLGPEDLVAFLKKWEPAR
jgi:thioredoxin 1